MGGVRFLNDKKNMLKLVDCGNPSFGSAFGLTVGARRSAGLSSSGGL